MATFSLLREKCEEPKYFGIEREDNLTKKFIYSDPEPNSMRFLKAVFGKKARRH
jgi:hypothetical protein